MKSTLKFSHFLWAAIIWVCLISGCKNQNVVRNYDELVEITVTTDKKDYSVGEPITVTASLLALKADPPYIKFYENRRSNWNFKIAILNERNELIPLTEEGILDNLSRGAYRETGVELGNPYIESQRIDRWFDLSETGVYTLRPVRL